MRRQAAANPPLHPPPAARNRYLLTIPGATDTNHAEQEGNTHPTNGAAAPSPSTLNSEMTMASRQQQIMARLQTAPAPTNAMATTENAAAASTIVGDACTSKTSSSEVQPETAGIINIGSSIHGMNGRGTSNLNTSSAPSTTILTSTSSISPHRNNLHTSTTSTTQHNYNNNLRQSPATSVHSSAANNLSSSAAHLPSPPSVNPSLGGLNSHVVEGDNIQHAFDITAEDVIVDDDLVEPKSEFQRYYEDQSLLNSKNKVKLIMACVVAGQLVEGFSLEDLTREPFSSGNIFGLRPTAGVLLQELKRRDPAIRGITKCKGPELFELLGERSHLISEGCKAFIVKEFNRIKDSFQLRYE